MTKACIVSSFVVRNKFARLNADSVPILRLDSYLGKGKLASNRRWYITFSPFLGMGGITKQFVQAKQPEEKLYPGSSDRYITTTGGGATSVPTHPVILRNAAHLGKHGVLVHTHDTAEHSGEHDGLDRGPGLEAGANLVPEPCIRRLEGGPVGAGRHRMHRGEVLRHQPVRGFPIR